MGRREKCIKKFIFFYYLENRKDVKFVVGLQEYYQGEAGRAEGREEGNFERQRKGRRQEGLIARLGKRHLLRL